MSQCGKNDSCAGCDTPGSKCGFVKSSAFAPVSLNLMGMYLVKEHMNAHYRRLYSVKAAVDTKAPHSLQTKQNSTKFGGGMRSTSRTSSRTGFAKPIISQSILKDAPERNMNLADKIDRYLESVQKEYPHIPEGIQDRPTRPSSSTSQASQKTQYSSSKHSRRFHASSDLLERHKDYFTKPTEPFVPRTLIRQGKSRLIGSRLYHPPVHRSGSQTSINHQPIDHSEFSLNSRTRQLALASGRANKIVPALNIQRDMDHVRWLEEQARKVKAEQKLDELEQLLDYDDDFDYDLDVEDHSERGDLHWNQNQHRHHSQVRFEHPNTSTGITIVKEKDSRPPAPSVNHFHHHHQNNYIKKQEEQVFQESPKFSQVRKQLEAKEEELRYLEFIRDVTNDILLRGIYTDQGLKQIFFCHMNRRNDLNQIKMKKLLEKLQEELGVSKTDSYSWLDMAEENFDDQEEEIEISRKPVLTANILKEKPSNVNIPKDENSNNIYQKNKMIDHSKDKNLQRTVLFSDRVTNISELGNTSSQDYKRDEVSHNSVPKAPDLVPSHAERFEFDWPQNPNFSPKINKNILYNDEPERDTNSISKSDKPSENLSVNNKDQNQIEILDHEMHMQLDYSSQTSENISHKTYSDEALVMQNEDSDSSEELLKANKEISYSTSYGEVRYANDLSSGSHSDISDEVDENSTDAKSRNVKAKSDRSHLERADKTQDFDDDVTESVMDILEGNSSDLRNETESVISEEIGETYMDDFEESDEGH